MLKNQLKITGLFLLLSVLLFSCKKDKPEKEKDVLTGAWQESGMSGGMGRRLVFKPGGEFTMEIWTNTYKSGEVNGIYKIDGDNLTVNISEDVEINSAGIATKRKVNRQLFEKGKFSISNGILSIKFISYPADAPVETEIKYGKIVAID
ncbi:hypothetical protein QWY86_15915 [Pedobacter aquatilis]|uniref:hypothetical protein n=1 Tax=Pedobacter aquatilis TaxID=351343 RepID=UPI0025B283EE|nr:hypothetical protein [Pedobacter aquatilis]MDN3588170.1 hypothetical protein [Pedobacter aquatilis]